MLEEGLCGTLQWHHIVSQTIEKSFTALTTVLVGAAHVLNCTFIVKQK